MTAGIAAAALRLGLDHPWVGAATAYCWRHIEDARGADPYTLRSTVDLLDAVGDPDRATPVLNELRARLPAGGALQVGAGAEGETLRPLDLAPRPDHLPPSLFADAVIDTELQALEEGQADDGGWTFTWMTWSPAAAWEWRGVVTVSAIRTLKAYGRLIPRPVGRLTPPAARLSAVAMTDQQPQGPSEAGGPTTGRAADTRTAGRG